MQGNFSERLAHGYGISTVSNFCYFQFGGKLISFGHTKESPATQVCSKFSVYR